jgi:tRNA modification GTPase
LEFSCKSQTCFGIKRLLDGLAAIFHSMTSPLGSRLTSREEMYESIGSTERQRLLVEACIEYLDNFMNMAESAGGCVDVVAAAEELRGAAASLGQITGRGEGCGDVEEVLGVVFEKFCVGK